MIHLRSKRKYKKTAVLSCKSTDSPFTNLMYFCILHMFHRIEQKQHKPYNYFKTQSPWRSYSRDLFRNDKVHEPPTCKRSKLTFDSVSDYLLSMPLSLDSDGKALPGGKTPRSAFSVVHKKSRQIPKLTLLQVWTSLLIKFRARLCHNFTELRSSLLLPLTLRMNLRVRKKFPEYPTPYYIGVRIIVFARRGGGVCGCAFSIFPLYIYLPISCTKVRLPRWSGRNWNWSLFY